tara:strand:- start:97 stop:1020 length:924 start_codon:yes stop_codon:yes gene_type:complete
MELRRRIVLELCPDIVESGPSKLVLELQCVLSNKSVIRKIGHEWHARVKDLRFVFSEKPTHEYLRRIMEQPQDMKRHMAAINDLRNKIRSVSRGLNPFRQLAIAKPEPKCKYCGGTEWKDTGIEFVCANGHCASTRTKFETGLDFRNIKERSSSEGDPNSSNWHTLDPLLSDAANRQTVVSTAAGFTAKGKRMSSRNLNAWNKRMYKKDIEKVERQIINAKQTIDDLGDDLHLTKSVKDKAYFTFCKFIRSKGYLPRENDIVAACLIESLPEIPRQYPKMKKRPSTPYNDSKQKRLKFIKFARSKTF